jgi:septal ring-binding cell division protein DamX
MKHKFALGAVAGITTLAVAFPLLAQISSAAAPAASSAPSAAVQSDPVDTPDAAPAAAAVSQSAAEQAALAAHPGKLSEATRLDTRFGGYKVEVTANDGSEYDVIVDSATGQITDSWVDGQGGPKGGRGGHPMNQAPAADASSI